MPPPQGNGGQNASLPAQSSDLAALTRGQLYRDKELIWYILDEPLHITAPSRPEVDHTIYLWPGVLKTIAFPAPISSDPRGVAESSRIFYLVTVPSVQRTYSVPQKSIIPFKAHTPNEKLLLELRSMGREVPLNEPDAEFDPLPRSSTLATATPLGVATDCSPLGSLTTDIGVMNRVAYFWTATDKCSFPNPDAPEHIIPASLSFQSSLRHTHRHPTKTGPSLLGLPADHGYQGLWFGAERIWVGDLLRLSFREGRVDHTHVPLSYFNDDAHKKRPPDPGEPVFLKLKSLIPLTTERGKEMYATGRLYRLIRSASVPTALLETEGDLELPRPPEGLAFESVFSTNIEARFPVNLVRGRYYPRLRSSVSRQLVQEVCRLQEMEGLVWVDPVAAARGPVRHFKDDRESSISAARAFVSQQSSMLYPSPDTE